jgi:RNA polymerase sigma-70 factor (ECF subfamily)
MESDPTRVRFPTTPWSQLARVGDADTAESRAALERLCHEYWFPLYAFARRKGHPPEEAEDVVQEVFVALLERGDLSGLDRSKGRFRSFLMAACSHHLANRHASDRAVKRGGGRVMVPVDRLDAEGRYGREPAHRLTPERLFDRQWALALLGQALGRLEAEWAAAGKTELFTRLRPGLQGDGSAAPYRTIAAELGTSEGALRVSAHRLRVRYRELLREEVARTTDDPSAVDDEIGALLTAMAVG